MKFSNNFKLTGSAGTSSKTFGSHFSSGVAVVVIFVGDIVVVVVDVEIVVVAADAVEVNVVAVLAGRDVELARLVVLRFEAVLFFSLPISSSIFNDDITSEVGIISSNCSAGFSTSRSISRSC